MMECEALDDSGALSVRAGEARYAGRFAEPSPTLAVGQPVRLEIALSVPTATRPGGEILAVAGRVVAVRHPLGWGEDRGIVPVLPGLEFRVEVLRTSVGGVSDESAALVDEAHVARPAPTPTSAFCAPPPSDVFDDDGADEPTGVVGNLREMQLCEIVQTLTNGLKHAVVELKPKGAPAGVVYVDHGQVVYAEHGALRGPDAFYALLPLDRGVFRIRYGRTPPARNVEAETTFLLLEAARRQDEGAHAVAGRASDEAPRAEVPAPVEVAESGPLPGALPAAPSPRAALGSGFDSGLFRSEELVGFSFVRSLAVSTPGAVPLSEAAEDALEVTAVDLVEAMDEPEPDLRFAAAAEAMPPARAHPASSPFMRFFDEAGIEPSPTSAFEGGGFFSSLRVEMSEDPDAVDSEVTARVRRGRAGRTTSTDPPGL